MEFSAPPILTKERAEQALNTAIKLVRQNLPLYSACCQNHSSVGNVYPTCANDQWTCGFWPGEIWLSYEKTGDSDFREAGLKLVDSFADRIERKIAVDHHDMGFLYSPSCVAAYKLTGCEKGKKAAISAARQLCSRFQEKGAFLQAWGEMGAAENYRFIIDCLLNVPLLYWAAQETGEAKFAETAHRHVKTCLTYSIRPDGSSYHTFFMNPETGEARYGATCQGYRDDSCWARGQAWAVYGTALSYRYTRKKEILDIFRRVTDFYLRGLPEDFIPYWDMTFNDGNGAREPRDSSSASIAACGLLEAAKYMPEEEAEYCRIRAGEMLDSLIRSYAIQEGPPGSGLVRHGTYSKSSPYNTCTEEGVDECVAWGDYFYMEALTRWIGDWDLYW